MGCLSALWAQAAAGGAVIETERWKEAVPFALTAAMIAFSALPELLVRDRAKSLIANAAQPQPKDGGGSGTVATVANVGGISTSVATRFALWSSEVLSIVGLLIGPILGYLLTADGNGQDLAKLYLLVFALNVVLFIYVLTRTPVGYLSRPIGPYTTGAIASMLMNAAAAVGAWYWSG